MFIFFFGIVSSGFIAVTQTTLYVCIFVHLIDSSSSYFEHLDDQKHASTQTVASYLWYHKCISKKPLNSQLYFVFTNLFVLSFQNVPQCFHEFKISVK